MKQITLALVLIVTSLAAWARQQTVTLALPTMNCAMCPITVKKALSQVDGVSKAEVIYEKKRVDVIFDDEITDAKALIRATTSAGYPSAVKK